MGIIDISGKINIGMWSYGDPFPEFDLQRVPTPEWLDYPIYSEIFSGMNSQSGTYLETPAHLLGYEKSYPLDKVALENLVDIPTCVIQLDYGKLPRSDDRPVVTLEALSSSATADDLAGARAVCISTGWGRKWNDEDFVEASPFIKYDAMEWLIDRKPFLVCSDSPRWENLEHPEGFFPMFYPVSYTHLRAHET